MIRATSRALARVSTTLGLLSLVACAHGGRTALAPEGGYQALLGRAHPLAGRVYARAAGRTVPPEALQAALRDARYVAIGETHDHPDHHRLQTELLRRWLDAHEGAAVAFEMLDESQAPALVPPPRNADELAEKVRWDESGWPPFTLYRPIFAVAIAKGAHLVAAHPSRDHVRASMGELPPEETAALALDPPLPAEARAALVEAIRTSHCGHATEPMVEAMVRAQSYKDAFMARSLVDAAKPALLIAGKGHVGESRGVPLFVARRGGGDVLTIALVEVRDGQDTPEAYGFSDVDYVVFTPRLSDADPCDAFRAQLEQMREAHGAQ